MYVDLNNSSLDYNLIDLKAISKAVSNIVTTSTGTIPGYPEFGCDLEKYLFEPLDSFTKNNLISAIKYAINRFEPRVIINRITTKDIPQNNSLFVYVHYEIASNGIQETVQIQLR